MGMKEEFDQKAKEKGKLGKTVTALPSIFRLIDSIKIYDYLKSYISYPSFDDVQNGNTKYTEIQIYQINKRMSYFDSKTRALEECKDVINYLNKEGYDQFNKELFQIGLIHHIQNMRKDDTAILLKIDNYVTNVKELHKFQPFFYDKSKMFWFWNVEEYKWEMTDETDVLVMIDHKLKFGGQLITTKVKTNYLEAFKQVGRINIPLDSSKEWVQFKNKVFNIYTGEIAEASSKYFMCNPIPHDIGNSDQTPIMDKLFSEWVGEKYVRTLYEIIAYCCYAGYPIHLIFCLVGSGRNGKSQFQKIVQKFIGNDNICSTELDLLIDNRFESAKMYKRLVCTLGETNFGVMAKTSLLKKLSGGDLIGYEFKNKTPFDAENYAKIIINSNALPFSLDTSDGFYRRWMIIDFPNEFPEGKDIIESIPNKEYNNLAKKVTLILPELLKKGLFTNQGTIEERKQAYIMASNPFNYFLNTFCYRDVNVYVKSNELYNAYIYYLIKHKKRKITRKEFNSFLSEEGLYVEKTTKGNESGWFIDTITLKNNWKDLVKPICNDNNDKNDLFLPQSSIYRNLSEKQVIIVTSVIEDYLNTNDEVPIEQLKADLHINDRIVEKIFQKGIAYEPRAGIIKKL